MNRHAKPSSAASNPSQAHSLGSFLRGVFATGGTPGDADGSGAPFSRVNSRALALWVALAGALTLTASPALAVETSCPNEAFRVGVSANLPDCRAYEMVSPLDKNAGDIAGFFGAANGGLLLDPRATYNQAAVDGNKMTYSSGTPFGDVISGRNSNQYMATRTVGGWSTHAINARTDRIYGEPTNLIYPLETAFKLFTPDLSAAWIQDASSPPLLPNATPGLPNLYSRNNLSESYEALTTGAPPVIPSDLEYAIQIEGHSNDFEDVVFRARAPMTADAFPTTEPEYQTYDSSEGQVNLVSVLPNGNAYPHSSSSGFLSIGAPMAASPGAVSDDGSRVFWTAAHGYETGSIFLRENPTEPESAQALGSAAGSGDLAAGSNEITGLNTAKGTFTVGQSIAAGLETATYLSGTEYLPHGVSITAVGPNSLTLSANALQSGSGRDLQAWSECTEPGKACTIPISETLARGQQAQFALASANGSRVLFTIAAEGSGTDLYEFDVDTRTPTLIAHQIVTLWGTVVGASQDASRVYFISNEALAPGATAGERNLYLSEEGTQTFVAQLVQGDVANNTGDIAGNGAPRIGGVGALDGSRISPDGRHLVFMSESKALSEATASYDNTDAVSGKADREVYLYEAGGALRCISCNPSGARPEGATLESSFSVPGHFPTNIWAAAWIPGWEHELLAQRILSDDGSRAFFNSFDRLVLGDTNGIQDVYQWQLPGTGDCTETDPSFSALNEGCISLISSGQSPQVSEFVDATPNGNDVFFTTGSSLVKPDPGLVDIYDARVGGGFDYPTTSAGCEGETCQGTPAPPNDATPASAAYNGPGNVNEAAKRKKQKKKSKKHKDKKKQKKSKKKGGKAKRHAASNSTRANG